MRWSELRRRGVSSRVLLHYASTLHGTRQYWVKKQRSRLIAMVDTLGLPTIFFTHSEADLQWPKLACLICESSSSRSKAVTDNPAVADWFFHHHIQKFMDAVYISLLGATGCDLSDSTIVALVYMAGLVS